MIKNLLKAFALAAGIFVIQPAAAQTVYNSVATAYLQTTISQSIVFDSTMQAGGTFNFSVLAHNGGGRQNQNDTANVSITFYSANGTQISTVATSYSNNLPQPTASSGVNSQGTTLSGSPDVAEAVVLPDVAAVPRRPLCCDRLPVVVDGDRVAIARALWLGERDKKSIAVAAIGDAAAILHHAVDDHRWLQVDLHLLARRQHAIHDAVVARDTAVRRIHTNMQIVECCFPPCARGAI